MSAGTAEPRKSAFSGAWGHLPQTKEISAGLSSFTRQRIERIISIVVALGSLVLGTQALLAALGESDRGGLSQSVMVITTFGTLAAMVISCAVGRGVRTFTSIFAVTYVIVLILSPILNTTDPTRPANEQWLWFLVSVATVASVLAFTLPVQIVWSIAVPLLFGVVSLLEGGVDDEQEWVTLALDVSFALLLGMVILALAWLFRSVALNVDETRARAIESYARAAAADAAERERVAVAALMHDSVLAALIAAERADTPRERSLAVAMAREALTRLANTEQGSVEGSDEPRTAATVADDIEQAAGELGVRLSAERDIQPTTPAIPGRIARALALAAAQAISNAIQHAGGAGLAVTVRGRSSPAQVVIEVRDTGGGFDLGEIPDDRLGIRASIVARVAAVGGTPTIESTPHGTTVRLEWQQGVE